MEGAGGRRIEWNESRRREERDGGNHLDQNLYQDEKQDHDQNAWCDSDNELDQDWWKETERNHDDRMIPVVGINTTTTTRRGVIKRRHRKRGRDVNRMVDTENGERTTNRTTPGVSKGKLSW